MRIRSQWTLVAVLIATFAGAVLLLTVLGQRPLRIAWHRQAMESAWREANSSADPTDSYLRFESHLATLVELGAVAKQEYRFSHLKSPSPESQHLLQRLMARDCPTLIELNHVSPDSPEQMVLTLWYDHHFRDEWQSFLRAVDIPNYRERYLPDDANVASQQMSGGPTVVIAGTQEYARRTKDWTITPEKAQQIVADKRKEDGTNLSYPHRFIVENYYAFVVPKHYRGIAINGYYVDGSSGEVLWLSVEDFQQKFGTKYKEGFISSQEIEAIRQDNDRPGQ